MLRANTNLVPWTQTTEGSSELPSKTTPGESISVTYGNLIPSVLQPRFVGLTLHLNHKGKNKKKHKYLLRDDHSYPGYPQHLQLIFDGDWTPLCLTPINNPTCTIWPILQPLSSFWHLSGNCSRACQHFGACLKRIAVRHNHRSYLHRKCLKNCLGVQLNLAREKGMSASSIPLDWILGNSWSVPSQFKSQLEQNNRSLHLLL